MGSVFANRDNLLRTGMPWEQVLELERQVASALPSLNLAAPPYNANFDGTDESAALLLAISDLCGGSGLGGEIQIPAGKTLRADAAVFLPLTGSNPPRQKYLRITGGGSSWDGTLVGTLNPSGSTLDLRYAGNDGTHIAKIDLRGIGIFELDHLNIIDGTPHSSYSNTPFIFTTNTTLYAHDIRFRGDSGVSGAACLQDVFQFGGISTSVGGTLSTNAFQGYGTKLSNIFYSFCRRGGTFNSAANGIFIENNVFDETCGSSEAQGAPWIFAGVGLGATGNLIFGGVVEITNYPYGATFISSGGTNTYNMINGLGLYDETIGTITLGAFYFDANSTNNSIYTGFIDSLLGNPAHMVQGAGASSNTIIDGGGAGFASRLTSAIHVGGGVGGTTGSIFDYNLSVGNANSPNYTIDAGDGTGSRVISVNGANTGSNGSGFQVQNNGQTNGFFGNSNKYFGGNYTQVQLLEGFAGINLSTNNAIVGQLQQSGGFSWGTSTDPGQSNMIVAGYLQSAKNNRVSKTTSYGIQTVDAGTNFDNVGATGSVTLTLPTAAVGMKFGFMVGVAHALEVLAPASVTISVGNSTSAAAGNITSSTVGNSVELEAISATQWVATSVTGSGGSTGAGGWTVT